MSAAIGVVWTKYQKSLIYTLAGQAVLNLPILSHLLLTFGFNAAYTTNILFEALFHKHYIVVICYTF